jgi:hypothetical protein
MEGVANFNDNILIAFCKTGVSTGIPKIRVLSGGFGPWSRTAFL